MRTRAIFLVIILAAASILGCSSHDQKPLDVAQGFWTAMEERDIEKARSLATEETAASLEINEDAGEQEARISFGEVNFDDDRALVETTMVSVGEDSEVEVNLETVLVRENGQWRVDVDQTMMSLFGGAMGAMMEQMGNAMQDGMEEMGKSMMKAMEEGLDSPDETTGADDED